MLIGYGDRLSKRGVEIRQNGVWSIVGKPEGDDGWKLHLSSIPVEACDLLDCVVPALLDRHVDFKVARDSTILELLNEGEFGVTQVGKFMTVYPESPQHCLELAQFLSQETRGFQGPSIVSDVHIGGVVYARYGSINPRIKRDRLGNHSFENDRGAEYTVPFSPPAGKPNPFAEYCKAVPVRARTGLIGPGYLVMRPLQVHAKGSVLLALDTRSQEDLKLVVLKEGRRHCVSDPAGRDMWDRLRNQQRICRQLGGKVPIPQVGETFQVQDRLYLPMEYIEGRNLSEYPPVPFGGLRGPDQVHLLACVGQFLEALALLHREGIVHRDLSPRNVRVGSDGFVHLIDFELSHFVDDPTPPFRNGTPGYVSPRQAAGEPPTVADDIYGAGALIATVLTGMDAQRLLYPGESGRATALESLSGAPNELCQMVASCLSPDESRRPSLADVRSAVRARPGRRTGIFRASISAVDYSPLVSGALRWVAGDAPVADGTHLWLSPEIDATHDATFRLPQTYRLYRSASRGVAGVVFAISRLNRLGFTMQSSDELVGQAVDWLLDHNSTPDDQMPGLHFGEAGVSVAIAEAVRSGLIARGNWTSPYMSESLRGPLDWPDLTHGAAGQALAAIACSQALDDRRLSKCALPYIEYLLSHQAGDGAWVLPSGVAGMEGAIYSGFAHGVAGIVYSLATCARWFNSNDIALSAENGGRWLLDHAKELPDAGKVTWSVRTDSSETWKWWCHGAAGISLAFLALYELTGEEHYARLVARALREHDVDVRYSNLSQCHGLAGLGEVYLEAYRVLRNSEWRERAIAIADTIARLARVDELGSRWLVENPYQPTADLMIGTSGVALFLARVTTLDTIDSTMPLMPDSFKVSEARRIK